MICMQQLSRISDGKMTKRNHIGFVERHTSNNVVYWGYRITDNCTRYQEKKIT